MGEEGGRVRCLGRTGPSVKGGRGTLAHCRRHGEGTGERWGGGGGNQRRGEECSRRKHSKVHLRENPMEEEEEGEGRGEDRHGPRK